jgi:1,4-dihydroxy-2-naphthoyl-CoA synthase
MSPDVGVVLLTGNGPSRKDGGWAFCSGRGDDGLVGQQLFAGEATRLAYMTDEAVEGRDAFLQKRDPDYGRFLRYF